MLLSTELKRDVIGNRPAASSKGRRFTSTDEGIEYYDDGSSWQRITYLASTITDLATQIQQGTYTAADDTGAANAYVVDLSPVPTLVPYSLVVFKAAHSNTGASTLVLNSGSVISIKKSGTVALASGDILAGQIITVVFDGTNFQLMGALRALVAGDIPAIPESGVTNLVSDLALKAPLASPTFTGTPAAPTPLTADNSTKLATTAYVQAQGYLTSGTGPGNGSIATKTAAYTVLASDYTLLGDATSAAFSFTLSASPTSGEIHNFKKIDSAAHDITIDGNGKTIDGGATLTISAQYASFSVQYDGTQWYVL